MFRVRVVSEVTRASKKEFTARLLTILLGNCLVNHIDPKPGLNLGANVIDESSVHDG